MRTACIISFCLLANILSFGQHQKVKKIRIDSPELQSFISSHPQLRFIEFSKEDISALKLTPDNTATTQKERPYNNIYRFDYAGHRYLFEQRFGVFPEKILLGLLDSLKPAACYIYSFGGKITAGSLQVKISSYCSKRSLDRVFRATQYPVSYPGGGEGLGKYLQDKITASRNSLASSADDSAFFFRILVKRDSLVHEVKLLSPFPSPLSDIIAAALKTTRSWTPPRSGGREVNGYPEVFVRVRKDGAVEADYSRW